MKKSLKLCNCKRALKFTGFVGIKAINITDIEDALVLEKSEVVSEIMRVAKVMRLAKERMGKRIYHNKKSQ